MKLNTMGEKPRLEVDELLATTETANTKEDILTCCQSLLGSRRSIALVTSPAAVYSVIYNCWSVLSNEDIKVADSAYLLHLVCSKLFGKNAQAPEDAIRVWG
jgi:hypothetical protein